MQPLQLCQGSKPPKLAKSWQHSGGGVGWLLKLGNCRTQGADGDRRDVAGGPAAGAFQPGHHRVQGLVFLQPLEVCWIERGMVAATAIGRDAVTSRDQVGQLEVEILKFCHNGARGFAATLGTVAAG